MTPKQEVLKRYHEAHYILTPAIERVVHAAMAWQEHCDRFGLKWVSGSPPSRVMAACRKLRKARSSSTTGAK
jgi:hypothetical protein